MAWRARVYRRLQNSANRRNILCDDKLVAAMGKREVPMFEMTGLVGRHFRYA